MHFKKFLLLISMLQYCEGTIERDLLLTPKESLQIHGRKIYYNPSSYQKNGTVPWEDTLKHVTFLTLFAEAANNTNLGDLREYNEFMSAPYTRVHAEYPRFGDIITMARGWVENSNGYNFKEGTCEELCFDNALAVWRVQKIRHRDSQRAFRYEMKFSVTPLDKNSLLQNMHTANEQYIKSFILKDDEYPKSFSTLTRRSDSFENFSNERQARIVNYDSRKDFTHKPSLNIGEFFKQVPKASSKVGYLSSSRNDLPTTYRPNYRVPFAKPEVYETPNKPKTVVTHHFHHHYFMNDGEISSDHDQEILHRNLDAIHIIEPPNAKILAPRYVLTTTTTEAPTAQEVFYMQQIPLYIQSFPQEKTTTRPFRHSEQQFEEIRYSEPDPLYENLDSVKSDNANNYKHLAEPSSDQSQVEVELPNSQIENSIIEQFPQSAEDQGTHIPYTVKKQDNTTIKPSTLSSPSTRRTLLPKNKFFVTPQTTTSASSGNPVTFATRLSSKTRSYTRSTTEKPILRWKPKQKPKDKEVGTESFAIQSNTEGNVITVTPSKTEIEILTQKSVSKSISVKVGNHSQELPLILEQTTTTIFSEAEESSDINTNENES
ncbi:uncharacterized protein LOC129918885 [Episyrphus balteatus]|uniref:uncharacterized protein LOC129918885 n=1 Tax=Episyrphus balteatus TaxID=286459 RepID=UPI002486A2AD|nr:uncharacterized protein LOC129918885 [Episyrphus balteatus]